jgi:hypothetical protein
MKADIEALARHLVANILLSIKCMDPCKMQVYLVLMTVEGL